MSCPRHPQADRPRRTGLIRALATALFLLLSAAVTNRLLPAQQSETPAATTMGGTWHSTYAAARDEAQAQQQMLLLLFCDATNQPLYDRFQELMQADPDIALRLRHFVKAKLPLDAATESNGQPTVVLRHAAFEEMHGKPGMAIIDYRDRDSKQYCRVISVYPFASPKALMPPSAGPWVVSRDVRELLDLPDGSLTQRTLVFAVRTHDDQPQSALAQWNPLLADEAEQHSEHQASLQRQGHHGWDSRFQRINAMLMGNLVSQEVCAESWPGQTLLDAARECVHSWRQSSGHWEAVRGRPRYFGYDMKRGNNGVWYATGIFGRER